MSLKGRKILTGRGAYVMLIPRRQSVYNRHRRKSGLMKKNKFKKWMEWVPDRRLVAICAVVAVIALLIPLYRLALYSAPWYDDYNYGLFVKNFLNVERSLKSAMEGMAYCVKTMWWCWQGTYSSIALMSLVPMVWGEQYYFLGPVFLITILFLALTIFTKVLLRDVLGADWCSCICIQSVVTGMVFVLMYAVNSALYWYNSGVHYIGMHSFMLLLAAAWIRLMKKTGKVTAILLTVWTLVGAVLAAGANYVTALQGLLLGLSISGLGILLKNRRTLFLLPSMLVYLYGFYKNISAPGNRVRSAYFTDSAMGVAEAVWNSFIEAFRRIPTFTRMITVVIMILLLPLIWSMVKNLTFRFRFPGLMLLWSFCFYAAGFTPLLYAMGNVNTARTLNAVKITFQLLLVLNEVYWVGWLRQRLKEKDRVWDKGAAWWFYLLIAVAIICPFALQKHENRLGFYSSYGAYFYIHWGEANIFHQEYLNRVETIRSGGADVVVEPYVYRPWYLQAWDLSESPNAEENRTMATWYGKNSISCYHAEP